jgi:hypothetical protein
MRRANFPDAVIARNDGHDLPDGGIRALIAIKVGVCSLQQGNGSAERRPGDKRRRMR